MRRTICAAFAAALMGVAAPAIAETITVATVNNSDMIVMQRLSPQWEQRTGNKINWVVLEENVLRQRVTTDIATNGGQFDVLTIGSTKPRSGASRAGWRRWTTSPRAMISTTSSPRCAARFQSAATSTRCRSTPKARSPMYRRDLFDAAGLKMPDQPRYTDIEFFAKALTKRDQQQYGICLRGKPGWGENIAFFSTMVNTFGGRWFDEKWQPQLDQPQWHDAATFYVNLLRSYGPPGASSNGFNENLALFSTGHCAMWIDATVAAGFVSDAKKSQVADKVGFAPAPIARVPNGSHWFWAWALAVPKTSKKAATAKSFLEWATSKDYVALVAHTNGWAGVPPGTRKSTYASSDYQHAAPFASLVNEAIQTADLQHPSALPVPYIGIQYVAIPEFQAIGTTVGQTLAGALTGQSSVDDALKQAQAQAVSAMQQAGYIQ